MQLFLVLLALAVAEPPPKPMDVEVVRDPITDQVRAFAIMRDRRNRLVVSCDPARYEGARVTFHAERWLRRGNILGGYGPVITRFDDRPPQRLMWAIRDRHGRMSRRSHVEFFLAELLEADRLVIRTRDIEDHRLDLVIRLVGVRPAVERALAACGIGATDVG